MWVHQRVLRVSWRDRRTNQWTLEKIGTSEKRRADVTKTAAIHWACLRRCGFEKDVNQGVVGSKRRQWRLANSWIYNIERLTGNDSGRSIANCLGSRKMEGYSKEMTSFILESLQKAWFSSGQIHVCVKLNIFNKHYWLFNAFQ